MVSSLDPVKRHGSMFMADDTSRQLILFVWPVNTA